MQSIVLQALRQRSAQSKQNKQTKNCCTYPSWIDLLRFEMDATSSSILLLAKHPRQVRFLMSLLGCSSFSVEIACSEEQAVVQARERPPFLIILAGDHLSWSQGLLCNLRTRAGAYPVTLVALTDFHAPSWVYQEENPGFDGFFVSPISSEVLSSLVQSAYTRQACCSFR